jgi:hypothetical protein
VLGANPSSALAVNTLGEILCSDGCEGTVTGQPPGLRSFLVPHRYWFRESDVAPVQRGMVVASSADGESLLLDIMDGSRTVSVPAAMVLPTHASFSTKNARNLLAQRIRTVSRSGFVGEDAVGNEVVYPPRCVAIDASGTRGWIAGWQASSSSFVVSAGLLSPALGPAAAHSVPGRSADFVPMTFSDVVAYNPGIQQVTLTAVVDFFVGSESAAPSVVTVGDMVFPGPRCTMVSGAYYGHLTGAKGPLPKDGVFNVACPGDVCRMFAADSIFRFMDRHDSSFWDLSACLPTLEACKRVRDALPGKQPLCSALLPVRYFVISHVSSLS